MYWMILGLGFAETDWSVDPMDVVDPGAMRITQDHRAKLSTVRAKLAPYRKTLREALALENWWATEATHAPGPDADIWTIVESLFDGGSGVVHSMYYETSDAMAVTRTVNREMGSTRYIRSNAKLLGTTKAPEAIAFGLQEVLHGRGIHTTSRDVLIVFEHSQPTHIYSTRIEAGHNIEALWTVDTNDQGQVIAATEWSAEHPTEEGFPDLEHVVGIQRSWTRAR